MIEKIKISQVPTTPEIWQKAHHWKHKEIHEAVNALPLGQTLVIEPGTVAIRQAIIGLWSRKEQPQYKLRTHFDGSTLYIKKEST